MKPSTRSLKLLKKATEEEIQQGLTWYETAGKEIEQLAKAHGIQKEQAAGIVAALSPNQPWNINLRTAEQVLRGDSKIPAYPQNIEKARRILNGEKVLKVLRGPKVRSFYKCLARPLTANAVCIDGHMANLLDALDQNSTQVNNVSRRYGCYSGAIREAARKAGLRPLQLQAINWLTWRRLRRKK